jgi:hypothetical protein
MSRAIKYRAWADEKIHDVRAISFTETGEVHRILDTEGVQRVPKALLQFTGFKDKHGREVYDGHVLAVNGQARIVIKWESNRWNHQLPKKTIYEIIGDIYQNPELASKKI